MESLPSRWKRGERNSKEVDDKAVTLVQQQEDQQYDTSSEDEVPLILSHRRPRFLPNPNLSLTKKLEMQVGTKRKQHNSKPETERMRVAHEKTIRTKSFKRKKAGKWEVINDHVEGQTSTVMEQAAEIQLNLGPEFPSFFKLMLRSHVTHGFWLGLPVVFCRLHLPKCDTIIVLEGEDGEEYKTNFLSEKVGLSGGWRGFSIGHKLLEGDVVIFHLVQPCKFKVYIVRANRFAEVDGALNLLNLDKCASETDFACKEKDNRRCRKPNENHQMPLSQDIHSILEKDMMAAISSLSGRLTDKSENGREVITSEDMDDYGLSKLSDSFVEFSNFKVILNDCTIDVQLSKHLQAKYYELCCTRKSYLHLRLIKGINHTLAAGIISETVNIADAIRASKLSTCLDNLATWDKTLEAFELLGMDVGFVRARLNRLLGLALGSKSEDSKRYAEAKCERDHAEEEVRSLELKLLELKQASNGLEKEMEALKENARRYEIMFQEEANAGW